MKKNEIVPVKKKSAREKIWKTLRKCPWKNKFARENFCQIMPVKLNLMPVKKKREKHARETTKVPVKKNQILQFLISGKFIFFGFFRYRTYQVGVPYHNFYPWKKNNANFAREKKKNPWKKIKFLPVKMNLLPVKKPKKVPVKKKNGREKVEKWAKKWAWKQQSAREKIKKKAKNGFHGPFFFHG